jgi:hypothetical protein
MATVRITPGNCNFQSRIRVHRITNTRFKVEVETECEQVIRLAGLIQEIALRDALSPITQSPLLEKAAASGLHVSCPIPLGVIKGIEVEAGLALPTDVSIHFESGGSRDGRLEAGHE